MNEKYYVGFATTFHDPAIAILDQNGNIVFAEASERHLQNKKALHCPPDNPIWVHDIINKYCKTDAEYVLAISWQNKYIRKLQSPFNQFINNRLPWIILKKIYNIKSDFAYRTEVFQKWCSTSLITSCTQGSKNFANSLRYFFLNDNVQTQSYDHHLTHAMYACQTSPFNDAVCLVTDGYGEEGSISIYSYKNGRINQVPIEKSKEGLGVFYGFVTELCGFNMFKGEEWKVMGLAPYGQYNEELFGLMDSLFYVDGLKLKLQSKAVKTLHKFNKLEKYKVRENSDPRAAADIAYAGQMVYAKLTSELLKNLYGKGISENLVLTGGCALNSSYNGRILEETPFKQLYVPSAPGDDGNALGAAMLAFHNDNPGYKPKKEFVSPYLGSSISEKSLNNLIKFGNLEKVKHLPGEICKATAKLLSEGKIVGWMQGRAEFGPRALGNRSILANPQPADMKDKINGRVKFREEFRPFAPSVLHEYGDEYFENYQESPYMERTLKIREAMQSKVPAIVHVNGTARLQTVKKEWNAKYYELIDEFYKLTGIPMLLNTSFNVMGKPIIHTVQDAMSVFHFSGLDALIIDDYLIEK